LLESGQIDPVIPSSNSEIDEVISWLAARQEDEQEEKGQVQVARGGSSTTLAGLKLLLSVQEAWSPPSSPYKFVAIKP